MSPEAAPQPVASIVSQARRRIQLGQLRPANTTAASLYTPSNNRTIGNIKSITVANTTAISADYRIFHDDAGTTFDATTAMFFDVALGGNNTEVISFDDDGIAIRFGGNLGVRTGTNDALTFTAHGFEEQV